MDKNNLYKSKNPGHREAKPDESKHNKRGKSISHHSKLMKSTHQLEIRE